MVQRERLAKRGLAVIAVSGLAGGLGAYILGESALAQWLWAGGTVPVVLGLAVAIFRDLIAGRLGVDAVALISMSGALALGENLAGVVVALMYAGGTLLEDHAIGRAEHELKALADRAPRTAHRKGDGEITDVPVDDVAAGDTVLVKPGEVVPVDGIILTPSASLDTSALTGEPMPVSQAAGEAVHSGEINSGPSFEMRATASAMESTYAGIVRMVAAAQAERAPFVRLADRFALLFLPVTLVVAGTAWIASGDPVRALAVLVVATPCPLILATPVAFVGGLSQAARRGVLIKGGAVLEALARARSILFDKTGTLTVGGARLLSVETAPDFAPDEVLGLAASLEQASQNIVAAAIVNGARGRGLDLAMPQSIHETAGAGVKGEVDGRSIAAGSRSLIFGGTALPDWARRAARRASWRSALSVFVAIDGEPAGALLLADELRNDAPRALRALRTAGLSRIVMVTGDRAEAAETIGAALDLDAVLADRVPADKLDVVRIEQHRALTIMVGDGINDAPALAAADVGVALGARGASASSEAADVVIMVDRLDRVADAVVIARRSRAIALQSILAGMGLSFAAMIYAAMGGLTPVAGALLQEAIDVAVILNALRALVPGRGARGGTMPKEKAEDLREDHLVIVRALDRLRAIADALDDAEGEGAERLIAEANEIIQESIVSHERDDESRVFPMVASHLTERHGLTAMSRAHREILHLARLLDRLVKSLRTEGLDRYGLRDAQRTIEALEALVRIHIAQEEDIYDYAGAA